MLNDGLRVVDGKLMLFGHDVETLASPTRVYKREYPIEPYGTRTSQGVALFPEEGRGAGQSEEGGRLR